MDEVLSEHELKRPIWLFGHSEPKRWTVELKGVVLDPRHPTRHNIWTSVAEYLQDTVFDEGPRLRVDMSRLLFRNAFLSADHVRPTLDMSKTYIAERRTILSDQLQAYRPPMVITFGSDSYAFVSAAARPNKALVQTRFDVEMLGKQFRAALNTFDPNKVNVLPLLHASVARASWAQIGRMFSSLEDGRDNYFEYVGREIGNLLLIHGRDWPVWRCPFEPT